MDLSNNLDHYRIFYMVAREGNITKAAEKLYISQPAVSMTIKNLEENLGNKERSDPYKVWRENLQ